MKKGVLENYTACVLFHLQLREAYTQEICQQKAINEGMYSTVASYAAKQVILGNCSAAIWGN